MLQIKYKNTLKNDVISANAALYLLFYMHLSFLIIPAILVICLCMSVNLQLRLRGKLPKQFRQRKIRGIITY